MSAIATTSMYVGVERADQHAAFVAGADDADAQPVVELAVVAEVHGAQARRAAAPPASTEPFRKSRRVVPTASSKFCLPICFSSGE